jgi:hypothetical protein
MKLQLKLQINVVEQHWRLNCGGHLDSYHINVRERILNRVNAARKLGYSNSQIQKLICAELQKIRTELLKGTLKIHN